MQQDGLPGRLYWKALATRLHTAGRYAEALRIYRQAILTNPEDAEICYNLGNLLRTIGQNEKAIGVYEHALRLNPKDPDILINLAPLYRSSQRFEKARQCYEKILELDPENVSAHYFLAALTASPAPAQAPAAYVVELFDQYAATYDQHMNQTLQYRAPELLRSLLMTYAPTRQRRFTVCDLGCGTGRSMEAFTYQLRLADGYDLSPQMLARAAEKKIYRELMVGDCIETLAASPHRYDLFVAADLLPYIGELAPLLAAIRSKALPSAYVLLSSEWQEQGAGPQLTATGRYRHSLAYVRECLLVHGMQLRAFQVEGVRMQNGAAIQGGLYLIEI